METWRGSEKRKDPRRHVRQQAMLVGADGLTIGACVMLDVSAGGARLKFDHPVDLPSEFVILLSTHPRAVKRNCVLAWKRETEAGIIFPKPT